MKNLDFDLSKVTRDNFYEIVVPVAKAEGAVTMYNFAGSFADTWKELITRFEAKYGIKVAYSDVKGDRAGAEEPARPWLSRLAAALSANWK